MAVVGARTDQITPPGTTTFQAAAGKEVAVAGLEVAAMATVEEVEKVVAGEQMVPVEAGELLVDMKVGEA